MSNVQRQKNEPSSYSIYSLILSPGYSFRNAGCQVQNPGKKSIKMGNIEIKRWKVYFNLPKKLRHLSLIKIYYNGACWCLLVFISAERRTPFENVKNIVEVKKQIIKDFLKNNFGGRGKCPHCRMSLRTLRAEHNSKICMFSRTKEQQQVAMADTMKQAMEMRRYL